MIDPTPLPAVGKEPHPSEMPSATRSARRKDGERTCFARALRAARASMALRASAARSEASTADRAPTEQHGSSPALGRRISETCNETTVEFGYDGDNLVTERRGNDLFRTVHADGLNTPIARLDGSSAYFILQDKQGSVRALVDTSGAMRERYSYTAYGETTIEPALEQSPTGNRLAFQGHIYEPATGLYSMRARSYAPKLGRFLSPDPIGVRGGANLYAFANNRPADVWDPFGLTPQSTPSSDRMPDGLAPLEPCVGPYCESRDGRSGFDNFDPRKDRQKIDDALQRALLEGMLGGCDPSIASCPVVPVGSPVTTSNFIDRPQNEAQRRFAEHLEDLAQGDRPIQYTPDPLDVIPVGAVARAGRAVLSAGKAVGEQVLTSTARGTPGKLYHYTGADPAGIAAQGLRPGASGRVFTTTARDLSPLQAQIDLALPPNRGLPTHLLEIDVGTLQRMGIQISQPGQVGRVFNMPGGGVEVVFPHAIPAEAIRVIR